MTVNISFILPIYNVAPYLSDAIESILCQNISKEIILVDDGSTDESLNIALAYVSKYPFIYVVHSQNKGVSSARNVGLRMAQGEYVLFLDPDDFLHQELNLEKLYLLAKTHNVDIVKGIHARQANGKTVFCTPISSKVNEENAYLSSLNDLFCMAIPNHWFIQVGTFLIRKEFLIKNNIIFDTSLPFGEDTLFNIELFLGSGTILEVSKCFIIYRYRPNSAMTKPIDKNRLESQYRLIKILLSKLTSINTPSIQNAIKTVINMNSQHLLQSIESSPILKEKYHYLLTDEINCYASQSPLSFS